MRRSSGTARDYPRTARLNHLIHEIVAEELERIDDERLGFLTVVAVEVERDLRRAVALMRPPTRPPVSWRARWRTTGRACSRPSPARPTSGARPSSPSNPTW
jgi:hypothetical protein